MTDQKRLAKLYGMGLPFPLDIPEHLYWMLRAHDLAGSIGMTASELYNWVEKPHND